MTTTKSDSQSFSSGRLGPPREVSPQPCPLPQAFLQEPVFNMAGTRDLGDMGQAWVLISFCKQMGRTRIWTVGGFQGHAALNHFCWFSSKPHGDPETWKRTYSFFSSVLLSLPPTFLSPLTLAPLLFLFPSLLPSSPGNVHSVLHTVGHAPCWRCHQGRVGWTLTPQSHRAQRHPSAYICLQRLLPNCEFTFLNCLHSVLGTCIKSQPRFFSHLMMISSIKVFPK